MINFLQNHNQDNNKGKFSLPFFICLILVFLFWGLVNYSETRWLLGTSISVPIRDYQEKLNLLSYCTKEMKPLSKNVLDINKMDNWFFGGDFNLNKKSELSMKKPSVPTKNSLYRLV